MKRSPGHASNGTFSILRGLVAALLLLAAVASFLPLIETNAWWVRYLDFVRLQLAVLLLVLVAAMLALRGWRSPWGLAAAVLGLVAVGYHGYRLYPYSPLVAPMAEAVPGCSEMDRLDVLAANVQMSNERAEELFRMVEDVDPDVFVVLETDAWWNEALARLRDDLPYGVQHLPDGETGGAYGMHLLSRHPIASSETAFYFGADTPTILADVEMPDDALVRIVAMHPRPPLYWSQPTTMRDAHLLTAAFEARAADVPTVVAGDLNAVPWERTTRRALRIGELLDPRVGRGVYPTYDVESWLMSWPLDHVLFQDSLGLAAWEVLPPFGSDHAPVLAGLCLAPDIAARQSAPPLEEDDIEEAERSIEAALAMRPSE